MFVYDGSEERRNGALNVVDFPFPHHLQILNHTSQIRRDSWIYHQYDLVLEVL